jgi:hypothetical protein
MQHRTRSWPKILATFVAGLAMAGLFATSGVTYAGSAYPLNSSISFDWHVIALSALLLVMAYPLAAGREWARRFLLIAVVLVGTGLVGYYALRIIAPMSFSDLTPEQIKVERLSMRLSDVSSLLLTASLAVFSFLFLSHPDIVASFHSHARSPERDAKA